MVDVLDTLSRRHALLTRHESLARARFAAIHRAAAPLTRDGRAPSGVLAAAAADLVYATLRHAPWLETAQPPPVLTEILIERLVAEYRIERAWAITLACAAVRAAAAPGRCEPSHVATTDAEFLRYVFVETAAAESESELAIDLGLGAAFLSRLRRAAAGVGGDHAGTTRFLPEFDAEVEAIMTACAAELTQTPWALSVHRLFYRVHGIASPWRERLAETGAGWLHDVLLALGSSSSSRKRWASELARDVSPEDAAIDLTTLAAELAGLGLVYLEPREGKEGDPAAPRVDRDGPRVRLTTDGLSLTAEAFARRFLSGPATNAAALRTAITTLPEAYQAAVLRLVAPAHLISMADDDDTLAALALSLRPLSPAGLAATLTRLGESAGRETLAQVAAQIARTDASPWLRRTAAVALAATGTADARATLDAVASGDSSAAVRDAARHAAQTLG